jgi:hypothetical protein
MHDPQVSVFLHEHKSQRISVIGAAELPAVLRPTSIPSLYVIPSGRAPLDPAELMASARLSQAVGVLSERFTHIGFDTPRCSGSATR